MNAFCLHSGAVAFSRLVVSPLDRWRTILQVNTAAKTSNLILQAHRGALYNTLGAVLFHGSFIVAYSQFSNSFPSLTTSEAVVTQALARAVATGFSYPLDVWFTRKACGVSLGPPKMMFQGIGFGMLGVPVYVAASLASLSFLGLVFPLPRPEEAATDIDFARGVAVGGIAALAGSTAAYPIDTIRRRVMVGQKLQEAMKSGHFFKGLAVHCFKSVPECVLLSYGLMCNLRYFSFTLEED